MKASSFVVFNIYIYAIHDYIFVINTISKILSTIISKLKKIVELVFLAATQGRITASGKP